MVDNPRFPPELEREIFELLAWNNVDTEARNLLVVAKRVHKWIEPLIYRVIFYYRFPRRSAPPPLPALKELCLTHHITPRIVKLCSYAHKVLLHSMSVDDVAKLLPLCSEAKEVALWLLNRDQNYHVLQPLLPKSVQRLSVNLSHLFNNKAFEFKPAVLRNITHLDVIALSEDFWKSEWKNFRRLTNLTHLAIDPPPATRGTIVGGILEDTIAFKNLHILLVLSTDAKPTVDSPSVYANDPRYVQMATLTYPIEHWILGARNGKDIWHTAEKLKQGLLTIDDLAKEVPYF
ncbi:hypothetical protein CPB83DRAFT_857151 [Crepidotus variabilis]|uniref:Uncharacterized protein n=1 Tax=Crepidotus variabilis TaxID=179855 RepID=A0A9P6EDA5_9AGAR|nr:hypothetical protein CPB83DRAFT_857151 [Crepidotus variabilis]